jgi:hypothetical protein
LRDDVPVLAIISVVGSLLYVGGGAIVSMLSLSSFRTSPFDAS